MTQDEIIRMAREAGFVFPETQEDSFTCWWEELERFAAIVAAHEREKHLNLANEVAWSVALTEREACAKVCDKLKIQMNYSEAPYNQCAAAIRARGSNAGN